MTIVERQKLTEIELELETLMAVICPSFTEFINHKFDLQNLKPDDVKETIGYLRVYIKYTLLDVEAERRLNSSLLKIIEELQEG
jgi:hypothetical protein